MIERGINFSFEIGFTSYDLYLNLRLSIAIFMRIYLYFADKTLIFTDETSPARFFAVDLPQGGRISRTKILNFLETHNEVAV